MGDEKWVWKGRDWFGLVVLVRIAFVLVLLAFLGWCVQWLLRNPMVMLGIASVLATVGLLLIAWPNKVHAERRVEILGRRRVDSGWDPRKPGGRS